MPGDLTLRMLITADASPALAGIRMLGGVLESFGASFSKIGQSFQLFAMGAGRTGMLALKQGLGELITSALKLAAIVGLVAAGIALAIGVVAVKAAADFQQGLNRLVTGAGDVTDNMKLMGQAILDISADTGVLTGPLLQAMYQIISAGQRGAQALDTLSVAAKGSVVEQANIVDVAKALTTAMTDYGTKTFNATQFMNGYTRAVQLGKITLEELSTSMGPILPLAKNLGISFADVAAAMATMTNAGIPAARAATSLRFLFQSLENPTHKAALAMKLWGLDSVALANTMKVSLPGALQMVYDAAKRAGPEGSVPFNRAVSDMIGGQRSLQAFLSLTGTHMQTYAENAKAIAKAMGVSTTAVLGWDIAQKNFNLQLDRAKAAFMGLLITIGNLLLPVLTQLLAGIVPIIQSFTDWLNHGDNLKNTLQTLSDIMAPLVQAIKDIWTQIQPTIQQFADWAVKNDVAGKALAFAKFAVQALAAALTFIVPIIVQVIAAIVQFAAAIWDRIGPAVLTIVAFIRTHWSQIATIFQGVWDIITAAVKVAWSVLSGIILIGLDILQGHWGKAWDDFKQMFVNIWNGIKQAAIGAVKVVLGVLALIPGGIGDMAKNALKALGLLTDGVATETDKMKKAAILHSLQMQQGVVDNLKLLAAGVEAQMKNAHDAATKHALQMKLDAINAAIATNEGVLKQYQAMADGLNSKTATMAANVASKADLMQQQFTHKMREMSDQVIGHSIIPDMITKITAAFTTMASNALTWGTNLVNNFAAGITAGIGAAVRAAQAVASAVASILKHSHPERGPLKDDHLWGGHFVDNLVMGISSGVPRMRAAVGQLASVMSLSGSYTPGGTNLAVRAGGGWSPSGSYVGAYGGPSHINLKIELDGREITNVVGIRMAREIRIQGSVRNR